MQTISFVALFCEDIRNETQGTNSLVGILPDNVNVPTLPFVFGKMGLYARVHLDPEFNPGPMILKLKLPGSSAVEVSRMEPELISRARDESKREGKPIAGFITYTIMRNLSVTEEGIAVAVLEYGSTSLSGGQLVIHKTPEESTVSTETA